jgi:biotin operon repressor
MNPEEGKSDSLKDWILKLMVSGREEDQSMIAKVLNEYKDDARELVTIRENGKITIRRYNLTAKLQILSYLIGAAYAKIAETRQDDAVSNKELIEELGLKEGTVKPTLAKLREEGQIVQKTEGLHRIDYRKLKDIITDIKTTK